MGRISTSSSRTNAAYIPSIPTPRSAVAAGIDVVGRSRKSYDAPRAGSLTSSALLTTPKMSSTLRQTTTSTTTSSSPVRVTRSRLQKPAAWTSSGTEPMRPQSAPKSALPAETLATISSLGRATMTAKAKTRMKPLFRKRNADAADSLDLGRSVTEDDGLGIYGGAVRTGARSIIDVSAGPAFRKGSAHHRSTSGASQFSTATAGSASRPYVHPMRQTPRPFTPPIAPSYATSTFGSDLSADGPAGAAVDEEMVRRAMRDASTCPVSPYSSSYVSSPPPLRLHTGGSASHLPFDSRSILGGTPSSFRPRTGTLTPTGTTSPTSRTSSDMAFRPRRPTDVDAASRAASIQAARDAFTEREAAKAAREEHRRQRQLQKQAKRGGQRRAKVERKKAGAGRTSSTDQIQPSEKDDGFIPMPPFDMTLPVANPPDSSHHPVDVSPAPSLGSHHHSTPTMKTIWIHFITWLRTRLYRFRRKIIRTP